MKRASAIFLALMLAGCPKDDAPKKDDAAAPPASASAAPQATASASASGSAAPSKAPSGGAAASFEGKYTATQAALYIPENKEYSGVKQAKDDGTKGVGEGTLTLATDGEGRVTGTIESGPAQGSLVDGTIEGGNVSGTVRVKTAGEDGLHGSLTGKLSGDSIEGTMKLADSNASILRDVKFSAKKK